jgi:diguanylate cyclase (GGDEF)-like protein
VRTAGERGSTPAHRATLLVQQWLDRQLGRRSPLGVLAVTIALTALLGAIDYLTGSEVSFSIFYLLPVSLAAWYARSIRVLVCLLCAGTWLGMDLAAGGAYSQQWIPAWNTLVRLGFFVIVARLLGNLRSALEVQTELAERDDLTGVLNARAFNRRYESVARLGRRHGHPAALGYIDLDGFQGVNDSLGHSAGDRVLRAVAERLQAGLRATDVLARIGGDEFAVLLPETDRVGAEVIFRRLHGTLLELAVQSGWPIGFSIGVAVFASPPLAADDALHVADELMYRVKRGNKNDLRIESISDRAPR